TQLSPLLAAAVIWSLLAGGSLVRGVVAQTSPGVATLTGTLSADLAGDPAGYVALLDLTAFVERDFNRPQPTGGTPLGTIDHASGVFTVDLPATPRGTLNEVGHGQDTGSGVQLYSVDLVTNLIGDPFLNSWEFLGWSRANTSLLTARDTHEV